MPSSLRERLAALEHDQWAHWTRYMLDTLRNTGIPMTSAVVQRWERQIATPYEELTEAEKDSDREWADKVLALLESEPVESNILQLDLPFGRPP